MPRCTMTVGNIRPTGTHRDKNSTVITNKSNLGVTTPTDQASQSCDWRYGHGHIAIHRSTYTIGLMAVEWWLPRFIMVKWLLASHYNTVVWNAFMVHFTLDVTNVVFTIETLRATMKKDPLVPQTGNMLFVDHIAWKVCIYEMDA